MQEIIKPDINPKLLYGPIVSWKFRPTITPERGKYCFKGTLTFLNGAVVGSSKGGFLTIAQANKAREIMITSLNNHSFSPFSFTVKEVYDYWLYYHMIDDVQISYNTFMSYRNIIYNYLLISFKEDTKIQAIDRKRIIKALRMLPDGSLFRCGVGVVSGSFKWFQSQNYITNNAAKSAIKTARRERNKDKVPKTPYPVLTKEQASFLLYVCKKKEPWMYMALLLTIASGLRIGEALGVKFEDFDFDKKTLSIKRQIGRDINPDNGVEIAPKTSKGARIIPISDFVLDEVYLAKKRYDNDLATIPSFINNDYLTYEKDGSVMSRKRIYNAYHCLFLTTNIPYIKWHGLRHTYSSLLAENGVSMKAISACMGHVNESFTKDVYITSSPVVYDACEELNSFIEEVISEDNTDFSINEAYFAELE